MIHPRLVLLATLAAARLALAQPAAVTPPPPDPNAPFEGRNLLQEHRWRDDAYGLSIMPPLGATLLKQTADDAILRVVDENRLWTMTIYVKRTRTPLSVKQAATLTMENVTQMQGSTQPVLTDKVDKDGRQMADARSDTLGGRPAEVVYLHFPINKTTELMNGQAVVQIDASRMLFAVLDIKCELKNRAQVRPVFEAVLKSFQLTDLKELDNQRQRALEAGKAWHKDLPLKRLHEALNPEQFFRFIDTGKDIGYLRVRQFKTKKESRDGIGVEVESHFLLGPDTIDSLGEYFLADDDDSELWTVRTTQRPGARPGPAGTQNVTFVETGVRIADKIIVTIDAPSGRTKQEFGRPPAGYLSQVESWLLPALLPIDRTATYGFYCYHSNQGKLLLRTEQVVPILSGFTLNTTLAPNENTIMAQYDANRRLLEKQLGPARLLQPATGQMIQQLWRGKK